MSESDEIRDSHHDECRDEVLDEFRADNGVSVERVRRKGYFEDLEVIKVYGSREERYRPLGGGEVQTLERKVKIAEIPAGVAYETLVGLAEAHGYRLEAE